MPMVSRKRKHIIVIRIATDITLFVLEVNQLAFAHQIDRIVIQKLELAVQFRYVVTCGSTGCQNFIGQTAEQAQNISGTLRGRIGYFVRLVKSQTDLSGFDFDKPCQCPLQLGQQ